MKTLAEQCIDQGREEGIQRGIRLANEAADAAFREFLIGGLEDKFGSLSISMREKIMTMPGDQLAVFGRRAMIADSLDELN